jgi:hypothetical protein
MGLVVVVRGLAVVDGAAGGAVLGRVGAVIDGAAPPDRLGEGTTVVVGSSTASAEVDPVGSGATAGLVADGSATGSAAVFGWADRLAHPNAPTIRPVATADTPLSQRVSDDTVCRPLSRSYGPTMCTSITTGSRIDLGTWSSLGKKSRIRRREWAPPVVDRRSIGGYGGQDIESGGLAGRAITSLTS